MTITIGQVQALTTKGIVAEGGVRDTIFKNHPYLKRVKEKEGVYSGEKLTFPFNHYDDTQTTGKFYKGAENLEIGFYDSITELSFDLIELEETIAITKRDLARNAGKEARLKLIDQKLIIAEKAMRQRFTKGIYSDGTAATGALSVNQFPGQVAFLKNSSVNYGGLTETDVSVHIAYVLKNGGTLRAFNTALHQAALGGCTEGEEYPSLVIMRQNIMNEFIETIKPNQRTTRESTLNGQGHKGNTLVYSGVDHITDNLCIANSMSFINENFVRLYSHPEYNMTIDHKDSLETMDATMDRISWKGVYACSVLRYQALLGDLIASA